MNAMDLQGHLDVGRLCAWALDLLRIPSPTGDSRRAAEFYAERLHEIGLPVSFDEEFPDSPSVVAFVDGEHPGPTLELAGHLDVIPVPDGPPAIREGSLYGRGACDMKGSMAAVLEVARVLMEARANLHGRLMLCTYGLHEAPLGRGQSLLRLIERGILGDAVICVEGPADEVAIIGKGMATFEIAIERAGQPLHELHATSDVPHPLLVGLDVAQALRLWNEELQRGAPQPYVGRESVFIGQFESGDFYNRVPTRCHLVGTRRYAPGRRFPEIAAEFEERLAPLRSQTAASVRLALTKTRDGFSTPADDPLVRALQAAYREVTGRALPVAGMTGVGDASLFANEGGVPAVYYGCGLERAHATPEYVPLERLERLARVLLAAAARFLAP